MNPKILTNYTIISRTCNLIVIPLSLSRSMLSRNCCFISLFCTVPVISRSLSASVDFPWSMCAMMQKFLMLVMGTYQTSKIATSS